MAVAAVHFVLLVAVRDGALFTQDSYNYGDLPLHWTYIRFFARGASFWPKNPIFTGLSLHYPVGIDLLTAVLVEAGLPLVPTLQAMGLFFSLLLVFIVVFGDDVQMHRVDLDDFQLGFAFRAIENLALFYFVLIEINLDGAFRAAHHYRTSWPSMALLRKRIILRRRVKGGHPES